MIDRSVEFPNRYQLIRVDNTSNVYDLKVVPGQVVEQGTPINKATLLTDATASLFGFNNVAVPNDILSYLGKYSQHCWKLSGKVTKYRIVENTPNYPYITFVNDGAKTIYYSSSINIDEDTGVITLVNPSITNGTVAPVAGYYYQSNEGGIRYGMNTETDTTDIIKFSFIHKWGVDNNGNNVYDSTSYAKVYVSESYVATDSYSFVRSTDRNAYPDGGIIDDTEYQYLGIAYDNAVIATKMKYGSYIGTGTYGENNANTLTFDFAPTVLMLFNANGVLFNNTIGMPYSLTTEYQVNSLFKDNSNSFYAKKSSDGKIVYWYDTTSSAIQFNALGVTYNYVAFS